MDGKLSAESKDRFADRVREFIKLRGAKRKPQFSKLQQQMLANKYHLLGEDQALRVSVGFGLSFFRRPRASL